MQVKQTILLVDDSVDDLELMRVAFKKAEFNFPVQEVYNGQEAISYLAGEGIYGDRAKFPLPMVMLLDLNMPKKHGFDVLTWVRTQPDLRCMTVVVLTASLREQDVERAFDLGANSFLVKPGSIEVLAAMMRSLRDWLQYNYFPPLNLAVQR